MKDYSWKRLSDIYQDCKVFSAGITPNDINQGALGNCYYLSVLSAMAEFPERIEACFHTKEPNSAGIYLMSLYVNGAITPIIVDDYVPVQGDNPCFSSSKDNEMWVMLLDKAWAKLQGSYARTEGGYTADAASHLMGCPNQSLMHEDYE